MYGRIFPVAITQTGDKLFYQPLSVLKIFILIDKIKINKM